jgi:predicted DNA-binding transcriptional regulator YafY
MFGGGQSQGGIVKRGAFRRLFELDRMLRGGRLQTVQSAAEELEVSARTVERDLEQLRYDLGAEIVYDRKLHRYRYEGDPVTVPAQWLNERELAILLIAERALRVFTGTPFQKEIHPAFNRLLEPIRHDKRLMERIRALVSRVVFFSPFREADDVEPAFAVVLAAILERRRLSLEYRAVSGHPSPRIEVDPYVLMGDGRRWYLVGYHVLERRQAAFALNMVVDPRQEDHYFWMPDKVEPPDFAADFARPG